jgi:hypothetical protein
MRSGSSNLTGPCRRRGRRPRGGRTGQGLPAAGRATRPGMRRRPGRRAGDGAGVSRIRRNRRDLPTSLGATASSKEAGTVVIARRRDRGRRAAGGETVILPTDTVYGLCVDAYHEAPIAGCCGRRSGRRRCRWRSSPPTSRCSSTRSPSCAAGRVLPRAAPGPVHARPPEPRAPLPLADGTRPDTIGVRVPDLRPRRRRLRRLRRVARRARTSTGARPGAVEDVPERSRAARPRSSTRRAARARRRRWSISTGPEPQILREGAVATPDAMAAIARATAA